MQIHCARSVFCGASVTKVGAPLGIRLGLLPLGLRAPRCLGSAPIAKRLKWEEMSRLAKRASLWGEEVILSPASPRLVLRFAPHSAERNRARPTRLSQPHSSFSSQCLVCRFRY